MTLHIMTPSARNPTADGKPSNEAMRCLKRQHSDAVYRGMVDDLAKTMRTDPEGNLSDGSWKWLVSHRQSPRQRQAQP